MANEFQGYSNMMNMQERAAERVRRMQRIQDEAARRANEELSPKAAEQRRESKSVPPQPPAPAETQKAGEPLCQWTTCMEKKVGQNTPQHHPLRPRHR